MKPDYLKVGDKYRLNPLSLKPGGTTVTVYRNDGKILIYDKIKRPRRYIGKLARKEEIFRVDIDGHEVWSVKDPGKRYWEQDDN